MGPKRKDAGDIAESTASSQTPLCSGDSSGDASLLPGGGGPGTNTATQTTPRGSLTKRGRGSPSLNPGHAAGASGAVSAGNTGPRTVAAAVAHQRNDQPQGQSVAEGIHPQQSAAASAASTEALRNTEQHGLYPSSSTPGTTMQEMRASLFAGFRQAGPPVVPCQRTTQQPVVPGQSRMPKPGSAEEYIMSSKTMSPRDIAMMQGLIEARNEWFAEAQNIKRALEERKTRMKQVARVLRDKMASEAQLRRDNARLTSTVATLQSKLRLVRRGQAQTLDLFATGGESEAAPIDLGSERTNQADANANTNTNADSGYCSSCLVVPATMTIYPCQHRCLCDLCYADAMDHLMVPHNYFLCPVCDIHVLLIPRC